MKALVLKHREWDRIFQQMREEYKDTPATYLLRSRMILDLGWTYREHAVWRSQDEWNKYTYTGDYRDERTEIHIDFYSEQARTFFMLKYMNYEQNLTD